MNPFANLIDLPIRYSTADSTYRRLVRQQYVQQQGGRCWYCDNPLEGQPSADVLAKPINLDLFPVGFLNHPLHLHHDHDTDLTIGVVHARCNAVLWQYEGK